MIALSVAAATDLQDLVQHDAALGRDRAIEKLTDCLEAACDRYERRRGTILSAPRPYPGLADLGYRRIKEGPYWIAFGGSEAAAVVAGVFHEAADLPGRL